MILVNIHIFTYVHTYICIVNIDGMYMVYLNFFIKLYVTL